MIESQRHSYHLVDPSPWPISGSLGALATTVGGVMYMHSFQGGATLLSLGLIFILYTMFVWWRDVLRESTLEGHHTKVVQLGPRYGFILFIVSEVMFLFALFRASSHSSLAPTVEIGGIWPPKGIAVLDPREIPFLNTLIPLSSGAAVTWAHHAILAGKEKRAVYALVATVSLALVFTAFQGMEYYQAPSTISDSIYGSTFFLATGFHGFHVIIGTLFSIICGIRQYLGHLTKEHHVGFEAAAWYWHFVDVVRLFPFVSIYWWCFILHMEELHHAVAPFLHSAGSGLPGGSMGHGGGGGGAPFDVELFGANENAADPVDMGAAEPHRARAKREWDELRSSREWKAVERHFALCDLRIFQICEKARSMYRERRLPLHIREESDIFRGLDAYFADLHDFPSNEHRLRRLKVVEHCLGNPRSKIWREIRKLMEL